MRRLVRGASWRASVAVVAWLLGAAIASAQIPDSFENLQLLPKDIKKQDLVDTMRGFAGALGVRCEHCHVGGPELKDIKFAADDKLEKRKARAMMAMVRALSQDHLGKLETRQGVRVRCFTCHHGVSIPEPIEAIVSETLSSSGADAALARYRELRKRYYGRAAYDFGEGPLNQLGESLARQKKTAEALAILGLNLESFPESAQVHALLGEVLLEAGDKARAKASFERALQLNPQHRGAKQRLEELAKSPS